MDKDQYYIQKYQDEIEKVMRGIDKLPMAIDAASKNGDFDYIKFMVKTGRDDDTTCYLNTMLHITCKYGHVDIVRYLVERGSDINALNAYDDTPLHFACENGIMELVTCLLEHGANVNAVNMDGKTPLHIACEYGAKIDVIEYLIMKGAIVNVKDYEENTPLHWACSHNLDTVKCLVEHGANVNERNYVDDPPLYFACGYYHDDIIRYLLDNGAKLYLEDRICRYHEDKHEYNDKIERECMTLEQLIMIRMILVKKGANVNEIDGYGQTLLHHACRSEDYDLIKKVVDLGADVEVKDETGEIAFDLLEEKMRNDIENYVWEVRN